jgi:hypothetical protein
LIVGQAHARQEGNNIFILASQPVAAFTRWKIITLRPFSLVEYCPTWHMIFFGRFCVSAAKATKRIFAEKFCPSSFASAHNLIKKYFSVLVYGIWPAK